MKKEEKKKRRKGAEKRTVRSRGLVRGLTARDAGPAVVARGVALSVERGVSWGPAAGEEQVIYCGMYQVEYSGYCMCLRTQEALGKEVGSVWGTDRHGL